jgi:murein L,D-transpeptidase YcbB/YkuD
VNTANQRLYMYEDGKIVDQMKVVVGRPDAQTPLMNAYIRHAVLNPYWNVPADIASRLAANVVKRGSGYLTEKGYQLVSSPEGPPIRKTEKIVWKSLANGDIKVHLRQLPGPANPMGRVKFMFPNSQGIWLHDTPGRHLLNEEMRLESNGCVRLEDAWRVAAWLFRAPLSRSEKRVEHRVEMPEPVPVYITYLTAIAREGFIEYLPDVYQRDIPAFVEHPSAPAAEARVGGS